jgi:cell division protein FtsB
MTDAEIIKALECCGVNRDCVGCPKEKEPYGCYFVLCGGAIDLINRQKTEIDILIRKKEVLRDEIAEQQAKVEALINGQETLQKHIAEQKAEIEGLNIRNKALTAITKNYDWKFAKAKSEAIEEYAAELYNFFVQYEKYDTVRIYENLDRIDSVEEFLFNNLVKEMTE